MENVELGSESQNSPVPSDDPHALPGSPTVEPPGRQPQQPQAYRWEAQESPSDTPETHEHESENTIPSPDANPNGSPVVISQASQQVSSPIEPAASVAEPAEASERLTEWRTWSLKRRYMSIWIGLEVSIIVAILCLEKISATRNGIANVPQVTNSANTPRFSISDIWNYGLLWAALPSLVLQVYRIMWETVVDASSDRQPYIELKRTASAKKTIMLDYRSYPTIATPYKAFENGHYLLCVSMILNLLLTIAIVPLTAYLFVAIGSQQSSPISLNYPTAFRDVLNGSTSLLPAIELATGSRAYGGKPPPWMTLEYAIESFNIADSKTRTGNITASVNAYSATLDCESFSEAESNANYTLDSEDDGLINYYFNDRGCQISGSVGILRKTPFLSKSWHSGCTGSEYGRVGIIAGYYSDTSTNKLANYSLVSCNATYWNTSGVVTVSVSQSSQLDLVSFNATSRTPFHPELHQSLEETLHYYTFFDASDTFQADVFGYSVYTYAHVQNAQSPFTPELFKTSIADLFQTLYAGLATTALIQPVESVQSRDAVYSVAVTRLYVMTPIAFIIVGVLALVLVCNILLLVYSRRHHSILLEEPIGLLGSARLLRGSQVLSFVSNLPVGTSVRQLVLAEYTVKGSTCFMEEGSRTICLEGLDKKTST